MKYLARRLPPAGDFILLRAHFQNKTPLANLGGLGERGLKSLGKCALVDPAPT
jgi:hypothetical protein